jgi:hypothetical protein
LHCSTLCACRYTIQDISPCPIWVSSPSHLSRTRRICRDISYNTKCSECIQAQTRPRYMAPMEPRQRMSLETLGRKGKVWFPTFQYSSTSRQSSEIWNRQLALGPLPTLDVPRENTKIISPCLIKHIQARTATLIFHGRDTHVGALQTRYSAF